MFFVFVFIYLFDCFLKIFSYFTDVPIKFVHFLPPDSNTHTFTYNVPSKQLPFLYNFLFSNRPQIKNLLLNNLTSRSLDVGHITCELQTLSSDLVSFNNLVPLKEIDNFLDELYDFLDSQLNQDQIKVCKVIFKVFGFNLNFSLDNNFGDSFFQLNLKLPPEYSKDLVLFLNHFQNPIQKSILKVMTENNRFSYRIYLECSYLLSKKDPSNQVSSELKEFHINTKHTIYTRDSLPSLIENLCETLTQRFEDSEKSLEGSGWVLERVTQARIKMTKFERAGLGSFKPFPPGIRGSYFVFNPHTVENCLLVALSSFLRFKENPNILPKNLTRLIRSQGPPFWSDKIEVGDLFNEGEGEHIFDWDKLGQLENLNRLAINIYNLSLSNGRYTLHLARKSSKVGFDFVPLLLIGDDHIALIRDLKKFVRAFTHKKSVINYMCSTCLSCFETELDQRNHSLSCTSPSTIKYPPPGTKKSFSKLNSLFPMSYCAFADLEALNKKEEVHEDPQILATQEAFAARFNIINLKENKTVVERSFFGGDCIDNFLKSFQESWDNIRKSQDNFPIHWSARKKRLHAQAQKCSNCQVTFDKSKSRKKHAHHDHSKEKDNYLSALCSQCNLSFQNRLKTLVVLIHNLSYDWSLILRQASPDLEFKLNKRQGFKYYSGQFRDLKFVDSLNMLKGSLGSLADEHIKNGGSLTYTKASLSNLPVEGQNLLLSTGKQFLPYEYLSSLDKLEETSLPPKEAFYSSLSDRHITDEDYSHALKVWDACQCATILDYLKIYLNMDVALLADIYLQWRQTLLELFDLDCLYFLTLASYAFDAFFWKTKTSLDCLSDENLFQLIYRNIRGGFCSVGKRYVKAVNKHTCPDFQPGQKSNYILYVDFNSLYPTTMSQFKLPQGDFKELSLQEKQSFLRQDICSMDTQGDYGYFLHIDTLPVPPELARKTDSFPLCLSKLDIKSTDLSPHSRNLLDQLGLKLPSKNKKLVAHHLGVKDYLISLPLLQFLLGKGLKIDKVHRIYKFKQSHFLKDFIDQNIRKRAQETNPFIKNALKLINNAIYGRTLLNQLNYSTDTKVCTENIPLVKSFSKPTFHSVNFVSPHRALVTYNKSSVLADSPLFVGFSVLDHAKLLTYRFWYDVLLATYGDRVEFIYSDTDSFIFNLETDDIDREIQGPLAPYLDLSNFPPSHHLYSNTCKGHLGKLKIETQQHHITEFVGLKPKMYSFRTTADNKPHNTLKGIPHYRRKDLTFDQYLSCLFQHTVVKTDLARLQFQRQNMTLLQQTKIALSSFEDKRYYLDNLTSLGYGHPDCQGGREMVGDEGQVDEPPSPSMEGKLKLNFTYVFSPHFLVKMVKSKFIIFSLILFFFLNIFFFPPDSGDIEDETDDNILLEALENFEKGVRDQSPLLMEEPLQHQQDNEQQELEALFIPDSIFNNFKTSVEGPLTYSQHICVQGLESYLNSSNGGGSSNKDPLGNLSLTDCSFCFLFFKF